MGTNYSFLLQRWRENECCGSLQHNSCKCVRDKVLRVARKNNVKKCENNLDIRKSVCIFAVRKVSNKAVRQ